MSELGPRPGTDRADARRPWSKPGVDRGAGSKPGVDRGAGSNQASTEETEAYTDGGATQDVGCMMRTNVQSADSDQGCPAEEECVAGTIASGAHDGGCAEGREGVPAGEAAGFGLADRNAALGQLNPVDVGTRSTHDRLDGRVDQAGLDAGHGQSSHGARAFWTGVSCSPRRGHCPHEAVVTQSGNQLGSAVDGRISPQGFEPAVDPVIDGSDHTH